MKKFTFGLAMLAVLAVACNKEQIKDEPVETPVSDEKVLLEITVSVDPETRATMEGKTLTFAAGDEIAVLGTKNSTTSVITLSVSKVENSTVTFSTTIDKDTEIGDYAYYPVSIATTNPTTINWPDTFDATKVQVPMMAVIDATNNTAEFKHLGAMLKVNLTNKPAGATSLEFATSNNFTGSYTVNPSDWSLTAGTLSGNVETVTVGNNGTYYIPIPAGSYADFQLAMKQGSYYHKQKTATLASAITPARKNIVNLGDFNYDVDTIEEWYLVCKATNWDYTNKTIRLIKCGDSSFIGATWNGKWGDDTGDTRGFKVATASSNAWSSVYGNSTNYQNSGTLTLGGDHNGFWENNGNLYSATFNSSDKSYTTENKGDGNGYKYSSLNLNWDGSDTAFTITAEGTHHWKISDFSVLNNNEHKFFIGNPGGWSRCSNASSVSDNVPYCAVGSHIESTTDKECKAVLTPGKYDVFYNDITGNIMFVKKPYSE